MKKILASLLCFTLVSATISTPIGESLTSVVEKSNIIVNAAEKDYNEDDEFIYGDFAYDYIYPYDEDQDYYDYDADPIEIEICCYLGNDEKVTIPSEINGLPVTTIQYGAFSPDWNEDTEEYDTSNIKTLIIPSSVTTIEGYAFDGCYNLENITIPSSVTNIDGSAFEGTKWLENKINQNPLVIVNNILINGFYAEGKVTIPNTVTKIATGAFSAMYDADTDETESYIQSVSIPSSVKTIESGAFYGCCNLKTVTMANGVTKIDDFAFAECTSLSNITIPDSVTYIGEFSFAYCDNLKSVKLSTNLKEIPYGVFICCLNLKSIIIPKSVVAIEEAALGYVYNEKTDEFYKVPNFKIKCYNSSVAEKYAKENGFAYELLDRASISTVSGFKVIKTAYNAIKVSWNAVPDADGYIIYRYDFGKKQWIQISNSVKTNLVLFTHLNSGTKYRLAVRAFKKVNGKTVTSPSFPVADGYTNLPTVSNFKVTATANNAIKLGWNNVAGANGYYIYRYDYTKKQWLLINNNVKTNSFLFTHLNSGTNYKFAVRAYKTVDGKNILSQSFPVVETSTNPANVNFNLSTSSGRVNVKWNKVAGATGYMVFYKTSANGSWNKITQINANTTSCVKTGLKKGQTYYFMVRAYKTLGKTNFLANYNTKTIKVK